MSWSLYWVFFMLVAGLAYDAFSLVYLYNFRSKEFKEQEEPNEFGTISLIYRY